MNRPRLRSPRAGALFMAIDPGLTGAVAALHSLQGLIGIYDLPVLANGKGNSKIKNQINASALSHILTSWVSDTDFDKEPVIALERIASMPGQGVASMFSMGDTFGCCRAVIACAGIQMEVITPQQWKKHYGIVKDEKKEIARAKAIQLYPKADLARKKDHNRAEALLIAHYLMQINK